MSGSAGLRLVLLLGATVLAIVVFVGATKDPVVGDTQCGPLWSQQFRDPCNDFHRKRSVIVVVSAIGAVALTGLALRHQPRG